MRQLGQPHRITFQPFRHIMRRGLPLQCRVHGQHHFVDPACGDAGNQAIDIQILWPHPVQRGQATAQHMITPRKQTRFIKRPKIGHVLHHAQRAVVAARIGTNRTRVDGINVSALTAGRKPRRYRLQRRQQRQQRGFALLHQVQHRSPRRSRPQSRQAGKRLG